MDTCIDYMAQESLKSFVFFVSYTVCTYTQIGYTTYIVYK